MPKLLRPVAHFVLLATLLLPLAHGCAALARLAVPGPPAALASSLAALGLALVATVATGRPLGGRRTIVGNSLGAAALLVALCGFGALLTLGAIGAAAGLFAAAPLAVLAARVLWRFLPPSLEHRAARHRFAAAAWMLLGLACVAQTARIATFQTDDGFEHGPTIAGFWDHHMCLPAYLQAAELNRDGATNVYDAAHYPGLTRDAAPTTRIEGMQHYLEDPFQYPPQFLLLPHAIVASGLDYATVRALWFAAQALLAAGAVLALARWLGPDRGARALAWMPLAWLAPATMFNFQYGQAHLAVIAVAVVAMVAVARGRDALGGALLGVAILAKLFPAVLALPLIAQRRWRALGWTAAACVAISLVALRVLGADPFVAFADYHLPRLVSGDAFLFQEAWPEVAVDLITSNQSVDGLVDKLALLGVAVAPLAERALGLLYLASGAVLAFAAGRRAASPLAHATTWTAALTWGALASPGAWSDYAIVSVLWLLALLSAAPRGRVAVSALAVAWFLFVVQPGVLPLVPVRGTAAVALSLVGYAALIAVTASALVMVARGRAFEGASTRPARVADAAPRGAAPRRAPRAEGAPVT